MLTPQKSLEDYPLQEMATELSAGNKLKDKLPEPFFRHAAPFLAQNIPLVTEGDKISPSKTIARMKKSGNKTANLIFKLYALFSRTDIMHGPQGKKPQFSSATPLTMAALKEHQGIMYEDWDKTDSSIQYFLGSALIGLHTIDPERIELDATAVSELRIKGMTYSSGKKEGETEPPTAWKLNKLKDLFSSEIPRSDMLNRMLLQTWVYHASLRHPHMILDPWEWDKMPAPWDISSNDVIKNSEFMSGLPF